MTIPDDLPARPVPWQVEDLFRTYVGIAVATAVVFGSWWIAAGTVKSTTQVAAATVAVLALAMMGVANCLWIVTGRRAVALRRKAMCANAAAVVEALQVRAPQPVVRPGPAVVAVPGSQLYHRQTCPLTAGRSLVDLGDGDDLGIGHRACPICAP